MQLLNLRPCVTHSLLGPNIFLSAFSCNNIYSSPSVRDQVSHPYKPRDKTTSLEFTAFWDAASSSSVGRYQTTRHHMSQDDLGAKDLTMLPEARLNSVEW